MDVKAYIASARADVEKGFVTQLDTERIRAKAAGDVDKHDRLSDHLRRRTESSDMTTEGLES